MIVLEYKKNIPSVKIDGKIVEILNYDEDYVYCHIDITDIKNEFISPSLLPNKLILEIYSENGFNTYMFHQLVISKIGKNLCFEFASNIYNKFWEGRYGLSTYLKAIKDQATKEKNIEIVGFHIEDEHKDLILKFNISNKIKFSSLIKELSNKINSIIKNAEVSLSGLTWKKKYDKNEKSFCLEVLFPLLRKMNFISVRYNHGKKEYGKDFTFSELSSIGDLRNYGLQAKVGNMRGNVNSEIDELIGQIKDAFSMPYNEIGSKNPQYISAFIIAISGYFTENAKEKISHKIPKGLFGSVYFFDRDKILELIEKYWLIK